LGRASKKRETRLRTWCFGDRFLPHNVSKETCRQEEAVGKGKSCLQTTRFEEDIQEAFCKGADSRRSFLGGCQSETEGGSFLSSAQPRYGGWSTWPSRLLQKFFPSSARRSSHTSTLLDPMHQKVSLLLANN